MPVIISIVFIPLILALLISYKYLLVILKQNSFHSFFFISGFLIYLFFHSRNKFSNIINYLYTFSHEISHALTGLITGNRIKKIKIKKHTGYVKFKKKVNLITVLAPYILPLYNTVIMIIYYALTAYKPEFSKYFPAFVFIQGFLFSFYINNTLEVIKIKQHDFKYTGGYYNSVTVILAVNLILVFAIIYITIPNNLNIKFFFKYLFNTYINIYKTIISYGTIFYRYLISHANLF